MTVEPGSETASAAQNLPQILGSSTELASGSGAVWKLAPAERDLDANIIELKPNGVIENHRGPSLGVLIHVLDGSGFLQSVAERLKLSPGTLLWLPALSERSFVAGPAGLRYFSVHLRKPGLNLGTKP